MIKMLKKIGYTPDLANNGQEAVDALKENVYQLVLMDVQMPGNRKINAPGRIYPENSYEWASGYGDSSKDYPTQATAVYHGVNC